MGLLPVLIVIMAIVQGGIGLLVILVTYTEVGKKAYGRFFNNEIALFDDSGKSTWDECCCLLWCLCMCVLIDRGGARGVCEG